MIYRIRAKFGNYLIKRVLSKSERAIKVVNISEAKTVGILYKDTDEALMRQMEGFAVDLKTKYKVKDVQIIAYTTKRAKIRPGYMSSGKFTKFFSIKETNFFLRPGADVVKHFHAQTFDLLIDFSNNKYEPLRFVSAQSNAAFKVGRYANQDVDFYDFMITLGDKNTDDEFYTQLTHYLGMINVNNGKI